MARIGILGGTFDPIHLGHLIAASELRHALRLDRVRFVPAGDPPHKPDQILSPAADRVRMIALAIADHPEFAIDSVDLDRRGPSYTVDTLAILANREPAAQFVFLMGEDSLRDLPSWRDPRRIVELAEIGVATRPDVDVDLASVLRAVPKASGRITIVPIPMVGISSRDIRQRARERRPIAFHVPQRVEQYIQERGLYLGAD